MDSAAGRCWVCDAPGRLWCSGCRFALYCSLACQKKDRVRHLDECVNSSRRRVCCSYCGREEALGGVPCADCLVSSYCTDSCRKIDAKNHRPVCLTAKEKVVEAARKINEWNRRAKGIPQYLGRLIHAVDYLRWSENEGAGSQAAALTPPDATQRAKESEEKQDPRKEAWKRRSEDGRDGGREEEALRILMLGADLKHVLRTLHDTPDSCTQLLELILLDSSPHILARDLLLLYLLMVPDMPTPLQDPNLLQSHAEKVVMVFYSLALDMETHALLCNTLHNLLNMTYKTFLNELRQQVHIDAVTYTLVQAVWNGWMSFANDPAAMQKLEKVRTSKMSSKVVKDVLGRYVKSCPREHQKAISDWIKRGSLRKHKTGGNFPNVTLACFSPLKPEYLAKFEDVSPKWSEETEWIKDVAPEDDMIYAPHGIDMIFQDWDFAMVSRNLKKEGNMIDMYLKFLTQVFAKASHKLLRSNQVTLTFIRSNVRDLAKGPLPFKGRFDRIATGIHADLLGTPFILQELGSLLRTDNIYARLLTHHRVWSLCLDWRSDQQAREMCHKSLKSNRPPDPIMMLSTRWATFRHFLQAELLHHLHVLDRRPLETENVLPFRNVSHAYDMVMSDYTRQLNHIVPFRFRPEKRMISMVDSRLHTLEWHRIGRSRRASAPMPANPAPPPRVLPTSCHDYDPASRYVDNLITLSRNSPVPSICSYQAPDSRPGSRPGSRGCSREGSMSPCPPDYVLRDEHQSRSRVSTRARPRSLYVPTRCKSPLLSPEFDFWEHQNLIKERRSTSAARAYSEIPEGISRRVQQALQAELKQVTSRAKSAPTSPLTDCKAKVVREKASAFERGSAARSTFPEPRRSVDPITPSTPVKKLVSMFSKAFATKEKEAELIKPLKRSNSFHGRRRSFENDDPKKEERKDYTNSLKFNRSKNADSKHPEFNIVQEIGMSTFPRRARPHSVATSNFSYLEGGVARERQHDPLDTRKAERREEPKKVASTHASCSPHLKRGGHIKNFIAGLNTLTVSPVMPRANTQQKKKELRESISVMRDELKLVNLRPGSPRLPSPVSGTPPYDTIATMDWPENTSSRPSASAGDFSDQSYSRKSMPDEQKDMKGILPREAPPSPSPSLSSKLGSLRRAFKKIPQEPEYSAPPLYVTKSPTFTLQMPEQVKTEPRAIPEKYQHPEIFKMESPATVETAAPIIVTATSPIGIKRPTRPEDIFSPKSSPLQTQMHLHDLRMQQIKTSLKESETAPPKEEEVKPAGVSETISDEPLAPPQSISIECKGTNCCTVDTSSQNIQELVATGDKMIDEESTMSPEEFMCITSVSMSSSLTEADMEVSELFSHDESFCPIKESKSDIIGIKGAKCIEQNDEEEAPVTEKEDETTNDDEMLPESDKKNELEYDVNDEKDESKEEIPEDCVSEQKDETPPELPKQTSPQVDEQCTPSVFKMVEHFAQRIQAEQQLIERPVSPKTENVLRRSRWSQIYDDPVCQSKDTSATIEDDKKVVQDCPVQDCQSSEQQPPEDPEASNDLASVQRKISEIQTEGVTMKSSDTNLEDAQTEDGSSEQDAKSKDEQGVEIEIDVPPVKPFPVETYTPKRSSSLRTTPVREISTTPVNKMVEQFAMRIKAQSLPASPRSPRPLSIGTLIQQDFLRLYSTSPTMDDKPEDEGNEQTSHPNDERFEETMFELSDDEEQKKSEVHVDVSKSSAAKPEPVKKESDTDVVVKMRSQKSRSRKETKRHRDSKNNELRHEFLQKIRGLTESPIPQERMKYDAIKATLSEGKKDLNDDDKAFSEELASVKALASSPNLDDMTVVNYRVEVDTLPAMDEMAVPPVAAGDGPSAIAVVADKECSGTDGDAQELCSTDYSKGSEDTTLLTGRNTPPPVSCGSRLPKEGRGTSSAISPNNSLKKKSVKKNVIETDVSAQRANFLKSSMGGRLDRLSFRNFVKSGINNENTAPEKPATPVKSSSYQVVEHTSSTEVSADEYKANPGSVEEAVEAISFLTPEDKLPREKLIRKFTLYDDDTPDTGDEGITSQAPKQKVFVRRKRLQSVRSASDIGNKDSSKSGGSSVAEKISNLEKKHEELTRETVENRLEKKTITGWAEARQSPQHDMKHIDEAKRSRQLEEDQETKSETSETSVDSARDIRRFMWGSLKRKKKHSPSKTKKEEVKPNENQVFTAEDPANKALQDKNSKVSAYKFFFDRKKKNEEEPYPAVVSVESPDCEEPLSDPDPASKGDTTPTIVAMVPKHKTKEPVQEEVSVHEEFVLCRNKTPPPETPPKPLRKSSPYREETFPAARSPRTRTKLVTDRKETSETLPPHIEEIASYTSVESLEDILSSATDTLSPNANFFDNSGEEYFECTEESSSLQDEAEVFLNDTYSSTDEVSHVTLDGVEVRPRAGVLKTSRDRSRESRRSLRVSWGDLPERMDSPVVWEKNSQQDEDVAFQREDADQMEDKTYRVTQL
ncbi:microtubule-associated protein futsch-like isoform X2 [Penaeus vannamei]